MFQEISGRKKSKKRSSTHQSPELSRMKACSKPNIRHHWSNFYTVDAFRASGVKRLSGSNYLAESQENAMIVLPFSSPKTLIMEIKT